LRAGFRAQRSRKRCAAAKREMTRYKGSQLGFDAKCARIGRAGEANPKERADE